MPNKPKPKGRLSASAPDQPTIREPIKGDYLIKNNPVLAARIKELQTQGYHCTISVR